MNNPIVSIIVPVYNCEKYLAECVNSVLTQTLVDLELLLVDDGSTDHSGRICDEYALKDFRVRVFHKSNGGVSSARNLGIDKAVGKYLILLDSDDYWIEKDFLNQFVKKAEKDKLDVLRGEYYRVNLNSNSFYNLNKRNSFIKESFFDSFEMMDMVNGEFFSILYLFKREILNDIRYDEHLVFQEDMDFLVRLFARNLRCGYLPLHFYAYRQHDDNASFKPRKEHIINAFSMCDRFYNYANSVTDERLAKFYLRKAVESYITTLETLSYPQYLCYYASVDSSIDLKKLRQRVYKWNRMLDKQSRYPVIYVSPWMGIKIFQLKRFVGNNLRKLGLRK